MGRRIIIDCDVCTEQGNPQQPGTIMDLAIRVTDPSDPQQRATQPLVAATLELCNEHSAPAYALGELATKHGIPLTDEAARLLIRKPPVTTAAGPVVCHTCTPPKPLRKGSLYGHARGIHSTTAPQLDLRPAD